jgi:predicted nucleic acid-binding protein
MPGSFLDSNVLLYVTSGDPAKADRAEQLIGAGGTISMQVLNEIANVTRRKMGMSWAETRAFLSMMRGLLSVQPLTIDTHETGLRLAERYGVSIYDAMIAASALHADCDTLWSEDMQDGFVLDGRLRIVNPLSCRVTHFGTEVDFPLPGRMRRTIGIPFIQGLLRAPAPWACSGVDWGEGIISSVSPEDDFRKTDSENRSAVYRSNYYEL